MQDKKWLQVKEILVQALEKEPQEREDFLNKVCVDVELKVEVMQMLKYEKGINNFLSEPLINASAMVDQPINQDDPLQLENNQSKSRSLPEMLLGLISEVLDGKYQIQELLGQGGMGAIFKAVHLGTERPVALKVINPQFMTSNEFVERFKREAKAAGRLSHPNVVNVTDFGFTKIGEDKIAYLVMEYLNGFTLGHLLAKKKTLSLEFAIDILEQVCLAIELAHQKGIIHRDLKPDNIWLEPNERGSYNVKVLDFGIAKLRNIEPDVELKKVLTNSTDSEESRFSQKSVVSTLLKNQINNFSKSPITLTSSNLRNNPVVVELDTPVIEAQITKENPSDINTDINTYFTEIGTIVGTPAYMSPEQCQGYELDAKSDIYSLGVIAYKMLAGEAPFKGDIFQVMAQHTDVVAPSLKEKCPKVSLLVTNLIMSALAKEPENRPVSAAAFALALRVANEGEKPIIKKSSGLFWNNFTKLFCLSTIINLPVVIVSSVLICLLQQKSTVYPAFQYLSIFWWLLPLFIILLSEQLNVAVFAPVVKEIYTNKNHSVFTRQLFINVVKNLPTMVVTKTKGILFNVVGFIIPGKKKTLGLLLLDVVLAIERLSGKRALARSEQLIKPIEPLVRSIQIRNLIVSFAIFFLSFLPFCLDEVIDFSSGRFFYFYLEPQDFYNTAFILILLVPGLIAIFIRPIITISFLHLYMKSQQILAEPENLLAKQTKKDIYTPSYHLVKKSSKMLLASLMIVMLFLSSISYILFVPPTNLVKVEIPKIEAIKDSENAWIEYKLALGELIKTNMLTNVDLSTLSDRSANLDSNNSRNLFLLLSENYENFYLEIVNKLQNYSPLTDQQKNFLDSYQPAIKYLINANKKNKAQYNKEVNFKELNLLTITALTYITLAQSNRLMIEGKTQEATDTLLAIYKLSTDILSEPYIPLVNYLIANVIQGKVGKNLFIWMGSNYNDLIDYKYLLQRISILEKSAIASTELIINNKLETEQIIKNKLINNSDDTPQMLDSKLDWLEPFYGLRLRTYNNLIEKHRNQVNLLKPYVRNYDFVTIKNMIDKWDNTSTYFCPSEMKLLFSKAVLKEAATSYYATLKTTYIFDTYRAAIKIFASCLIYKKVHGHFPKTLEEAFSNNITAIPYDPVTQKLVGYRLENNIPVVWFAGYDGVDNGGVMNSESKNYGMALSGRDWIFRLGELPFFYK